jgi:hypothetical protein
VNADVGSCEAEPSSVLDLAENFYLANVLDALEELGILDSLEAPVSVRCVAKRHRVNAGILEAALQMLALRTNLVVQQNGKYSLSHAYDPKTRFMLHQYLGAYGRNAIEFGVILRDTSRAGEVIDRRRHAKAFAQIDTMSPSIVADLMHQLEFNHVLDLGCGTGTLLVNLALRNLKFVGWGVDVNPWMCAEARKRIASTCVGRRVNVFEGDCRALDGSIPPHVRKSVRTISAASVANEFFAEGVDHAVEWLGRLKASFPGRVMLLADYYGQLGSAGTPRSREVALHDFVQAISGQGVPPVNLRAWKRIYRAAGCHLVSVVELEQSPFFVHLLRL